MKSESGSKLKPFAAVPAAMPRSGIREVMDLAWAAEKSGPVIHLEVGQPDFDTPDHIREATCRWVREGDTKYVPNAGVSELRSAVARRFESRTGVPTSPEHILVTTGAVLSVATAFMTLLEPGEEVLLPDPAWPNYRMGVALAHGRAVYYDQRADRGFLPEPEAIERLVTPRTKLLLLCSPSNPSGQLYDAALLAELMALARRHNLYVLSDEVYEDIVFDGRHASALSFDSDERSLIVSGVSKSYAMTGYRVGFTRARPDYVAVAAKLQEPFVSCGTGFSQRAAVAALEGPQDCVREMCAAYKRRRDAAVEVLRARGLHRYTPRGAFYVLVDVSGAGMASRDFAIRLLAEKRVAVAPGSAFGRCAEGHVRVSLASSEPSIRDGLSRLADLLDELAAAPAPAPDGR